MSEVGVNLDDNSSALVEAANVRPDRRAEQRAPYVCSQAVAFCSGSEVSGLGCSAGVIVGAAGMPVAPMESELVLEGVEALSASTEKWPK